MSDEQKLALRLEGVGVYYPRHGKVLGGEAYWALRDVSFNLYHGETLGVIGRNGVGKSTLLRMLAGIISPDKGRLLNYAGRAVLLSLQVGFVSHLTGRENAVLSGMLLGMRRREIEDRLEGIIEFSDLGEFIDEPAGTYSSGMRARLGFAVAYQAKPDILLIDEVLGVGDNEFKQKSSLAMKERIQSDQTVVIVSHNHETIAELCDRVVWLEHGQTKAEGPTEEILTMYEQSQTRSGKAKGPR